MKFQYPQPTDFPTQMLHIDTRFIEAYSTIEPWTNSIDLVDLIKKAWQFLIFSPIFKPNFIIQRWKRKEGRKTEVKP